MREQATQLYLGAFWQKFRPILGNDKTRAVACFAPKLNLDRVYCAIDGEQLLGIAGFKQDGTGFFDTDIATLQSVYGWFGGLWRGLALSIFDRDKSEGQLLMDGIVVAQAARGKGIGTKLLNAIETHARQSKVQSIRLDVVDTNPDARRLYERFGFEATSTERLGLLKPIFGFSASTTMIKTVENKPGSV